MLVMPTSSIFLITGTALRNLRRLPHVGRVPPPSRRFGVTAPHSYFSLSEAELSNPMACGLWYESAAPYNQIKTRQSFNKQRCIAVIDICLTNIRSTGIWWLSLCHTVKNSSCTSLHTPRSLQFTTPLGCGQTLRGFFST